MQNVRPRLSVSWMANARIARSEAARAVEGASDVRRVTPRLLWVLHALGKTIYEHL